MSTIIKPNNGKRGGLDLRRSAVALLLIFATAAVNAAGPSRSTNIALYGNGTRLINVNEDSNSVTVFKVNSVGGPDNSLTKFAEIPVGFEPHCVAVRPDNKVAFVTTADGYVDVVSLDETKQFRVLKRILVGTEPRGCALTPSGKILYIANHTSSSVSLIDTTALSVTKTITTGFNRPFAVAISNDGDADDTDEFIFVSDFFAQLNPGAAVRGEPFDDGKRGVVRVFPFGLAPFVNPIFLSPLADAGFPANRALFCPKGNPALHSDVYCPDINANVTDPVIAEDKQGAFPNQLHALLIRGNRMYVPSIGAAPEPPVGFNVNVQALMHVVDTVNVKEIKANTVNLNAQIKTEPDAAAGGIGKLFGNDIVAMDANAAGTQFVIVSRGGNYVLKAGLANGKINIGAPNNVVRLRTGHIPTGVVVSGDGNRAYTNNQVGRSVSVLDLAGNSVIARDVESTALPPVGSFEHNVLMGKLVFFTALGVPDNGLSQTAIRTINPLTFRGKQSNNAWSTCASCHPAGLADGVTWVFPDGPRQSIPLDGTYSKRSAAHDARILNWSAVRGSNTDFNNNSIGVQGGTGFAGIPPNPNIFNHGITQGASEALDDETLWIQTIRPFAQPPQKPLADVNAGRTVFKNNCASCHGSAKWTKSEILYRDNPALVDGVPRDPDVDLAADGGGQILSFSPAGESTLNYLEVINTFLAANPLEIKGAGANAGKTAFGVSGFNVPSLLGVRYHAPYLHDGSATKLSDVFTVHKLKGGTIENQLSASARANLLKFLNTIDGKTVPLRSEADDVRDPK